MKVFFETQSSLQLEQSVESWAGSSALTNRLSLHSQRGHTDSDHKWGKRETDIERGRETERKRCLLIS